MSHITTIHIEIRDLDALQSACLDLGATLVRHVPTYTWYGKRVGDYPLPEGMTEADLGKCAHVIRVPGIRYEIGVVQRGQGYSLAYDFWGKGQVLKGVVHDGEKLKEHFSEGLTRLVDHYGAHVAMSQLRRIGKTPVRSTLPNGAVVVSCAF